MRPPARKCDAQFQSIPAVAFAGTTVHCRPPLHAADRLSGICAGRGKSVPTPETGWAIGDRRRGFVLRQHRWCGIHDAGLAGSIKERRKCLGAYFVQACAHQGSRWAVLGRAPSCRGGDGCIRHVVSHLNGPRRGNAAPSRANGARCWSGMDAASTAAPSLIPAPLPCVLNVVDCHGRQRRRRRHLRIDRSILRRPEPRSPPQQVHGFRPGIRAVPPVREGVWRSCTGL